MPFSQTRRRSIAAATTALIAATLAVVYGQALRTPLVDNDSFTVVFSQSTLGNWDVLADLFSPTYFSRFGIGGWRPLSMLAYSILFRLCDIDPFAYKLFKLALHALSSAFVFRIGDILLRDRRWALAGAAAYFLRLQQTAFDGLAFFPDSMAAFFSLAAAFNHLQGAREQDHSSRRTLITAGLYGCALLSKESALALPALLVMCEICLPAIRSGGWRRSLAAVWPLLIVAALYLGISKWWIVVENFYGPAEWTARVPAERILLDYRAYWREFFAGDVTLIVGCLGLAWIAVDHDARVVEARWLSFCLGWTLMSLWSVLNIWPFFPRFESYLLHTESRFLALPGAAMAWLFGYWGSSCQRRRGLGRAAWLLAAWWLAASAWTDFRRRADWEGRLLAGLRRDVEAFAGGEPERPFYGSTFSQAVLSLPLIRRSAPQLAAEIEKTLRQKLPRRDADEILDFFRDESLYRQTWKSKLSVQLMNQESLPGFLSALAAETAYHRGKDRLAQNEPQDALAAFRAALARDPEHEAACLGIAAAYQAGGREPRAAAQILRCRDAGLLREEFAAEESSRASVRESAQACSRALSEMRLADALRHFDSLRDGMGPLWRVDLRLSRAGVLTRKEEYLQAAQAYAQVLREAPSTWQGRGSVERELARLKCGSRAAFDSAMRAFAGGDVDKAIAGFGEALRLSPDFVEAYLSRGALYANQGRWQDALRDYDEGLRQPSVSRNKILQESLRSARATAKRRSR